MEKPEATYETERERTLRVLKESGLLDEPDGQPSLSADSLQREIEQPDVTCETERERTLRVLKESGLLDEPLGPSWDKYAAGAPLLTHEELWELLKGQRPLSDDIIEMRGEL